MADIIPPGYAQVTVPLAHVAVSRAAAVVFGVDAGGQPDPDLLADSVQARFNTAFGGIIDSNVTIGPTRVVVGQDGGENTQGAASGQVAGTRTGETVTPQVAVLFKKRSNRGGRRGSGRMYLPFALNETDVTEAGTLTSATVTANNTRGATFLSGLAADSTELVILHSVGQTTPGLPNVVTTLVCDPICATQRRRLVRRF